uniref:(northern house mosquito) hypothetical protein n=1 Tax=Culex pipiens TaxID=7175 RepID=A0A8D8H942_CULPI
MILNLPVFHPLCILLLHGIQDILYDKFVLYDSFGKRCRIDLGTAETVFEFRFDIDFLAQIGIRFVDYKWHFLFNCNFPIRPKFAARNTSTLGLLDLRWSLEQQAVISNGHIPLGTPQRA